MSNPQSQNPIEEPEKSLTEDQKPENSQEPVKVESNESLEEGELKLDLPDDDESQVFIYFLL